MHILWNQCVCSREFTGDCQHGEWISLKFGGIVRQLSLVHGGCVCETMYNNKQQPWISTVKYRRIVAWWRWRMPLFHCIGLMAKVSIQEFQANAGEFQHIEIIVSSLTECQLLLEAQSFANVVQTFAQVQLNCAILRLHMLLSLVHRCSHVLSLAS